MAHGEDTHFRYELASISSMAIFGGHVECPIDQVVSSEVLRSAACRW